MQSERQNPGQRKSKKHALLLIKLNLYEKVTTLTVVDSDECINVFMNLSLLSSGFWQF